MKKIKILRIITRLNIGGPAIHAILLTDGLDKQRFDSLLVYGNVAKDEGNMYYYAEQKNLNPIFIPELKREINLSNDIIAFKKIYKLIKHENPDIIHTHTAKAGTLGRLAAIIYILLSRRKIKIIHTFHGHVFEGYFNKFKTNLFILIEKFLGAFTSKIITVSNTVKKELLELGIASDSKIDVIPLGFELEKFLAIPKNNKPFLRVGIIGRLVPIKNHKLFLEAASIVNQYSPRKELKFQVVGDGQLKNELEEYSRLLGLSNNVEFLGWRNDLTQVYSDLDIVALTSINEGTPVSIIEALASKRAVVATNVGGVKDILGEEIKNYSTLSKGFKVLDRGIIIMAKNAITLAKALILLLEDNKLRLEMGIAGRNFVRIHFTKERLIRDIENLYYRYRD